MSAETTLVIPRSERSTRALLDVAIEAEDSRGAGRESSALRALAAAAQRCAVTLPDDAAPADRATSRSAGEYPEHIARLHSAVHQAVLGKTPNLGSLPSYVPARRLLDELRSAFLSEVSSRPTMLGTSDVVRVLKALDQVQTALGGDAAQRLASRLAGPDALELVVAVAHDMRSPLTSLLFLVETLRTGRSGPLTPQQEQQLRIVYSAAFGLNVLASDLMDLARGGDRLLDVHDIAFSIRECMYSVRDIVQPIAEEKSLTLEINPPDIDYRMGRPGALGRVLLNLITNALKFTSSGKVCCRAREVSRSRIEFSVSDTGRGIPEDVAGTLFDAFRKRGRSQEYIFSSAGLGLSICRKLVAALGGELTMRKRVGGGTCFSFQLDLPRAKHLQHG